MNKIKLSLVFIFKAITGSECMLLQLQLPYGMNKLNPLKTNPQAKEKSLKQHVNTDVAVICNNHTNNELCIDINIDYTDIKIIICSIAVPHCDHWGQ